jgi:hypothetical protein
LAKSDVRQQVVENDLALTYNFDATSRYGDNVYLGKVELSISEGLPDGPPDMTLRANALVDGSTYAARIYENVTRNAFGKLKGSGGRVSLTRYALEKFGDYYQRRFRMPLRVWHGHLAWGNKLIFQRKYALETMIRGLSEEEAALSAIQTTPFGHHRITMGFTKFEVSIASPVEIDFGGDLGVCNVPDYIAVLAEKP